MTHTNLITAAFLLLTGLTSCEETTDRIDNNPGTDPDNSEWLIPVNEVSDGGPGKDGIPALTDPEFINAFEASFMKETDLVLGIKIGDEVRAYPHLILDWHEIINDQINDEYFAITYCPLTGTGIAWNRDLESGVTTFGVSGLLYNTNLLPYDRATDSYWSQMRLDCVHGEKVSDEIKTYPVVETTWKIWQKMYPETKVVSSKTGYSRSYGNYPYGSYRTDDNYIIFPVSNKDSRIPNKERVHGIITSEKVITFRFSEFNEGTKVLKETISGNEILIIGNSSDNFIVSFFTDNNSTISYSAIQNEYPLVLMDSRGNKFDVFGIATEGPEKFKILTPTKSFIGYWFSWAAFYPELEIFE